MEEWQSPIAIFALLNPTKNIHRAKLAKQTHLILTKNYVPSRYNNGYEEGYKIY